jgi:hypothetical protein
MPRRIADDGGDLMAAPKERAHDRGADPAASAEDHEGRMAGGVIGGHIVTLWPTLAVTST